MVSDHGLLRLFYDNSHCVAEGKLWRTYQPSPKKLVKWKERGIRTVINLRGSGNAGHYILEEDACKELDLALVNFQVYSREAPTVKILTGAKALFDTIEYPAVMHCKSGADRTGVMGVLYHFLHEKKSLDEAMAQLSFRYGHIKQGKTGVIDYFFDTYKEYARAHNIALDDQDAFLHWAETELDPKKIKENFMAKGRTTWWGRLLTEQILHRE